MSRTWRGVVVLGGAAVIAALVAHVGPTVVADMLRQIGWTLLPVSALYAAHVGVRAFALWRGLPDGLLPFRDVLHVRIACETVESLTLTGPWLAEPAKGWLLKQRGVGVADAFGFVALEYLLYMLVASWMAAGALAVLLERHLLPHAFDAPMIAVEVGIGAITVGFAYAVLSGHGLIVPTLRRLGAVTGVRGASTLAARLAPGERALVRFLSVRRTRLFEVIVAEAFSHVLLAGEIAIVFRTIAVNGRWGDSLVFEGAAKFISAVFFFVPGQVGAQEGVYTLLAAALGAPAVAGLTLALARRMRGFIIGVAGLAMMWAVPGRRVFTNE